METKTSVLSCTLLLVFSGLKCHISVTQSPKCTRLKRITNQFSFCVHCCQIPIYTAVMSNYVQSQIIITLLYIILTSLNIMGTYTEQPGSRPPSCTTPIDYILIWIWISSTAIFSGKSIRRNFEATI